jgi:hypothetical protein
MEHERGAFKVKHDVMGNAVKNSAEMAPFAGPPNRLWDAAIGAANLDILSYWPMN